MSDPAADGTRCNRLHAAALPCHWLHPIQATAKAPLAESRGVCAALWPRIGSDVSEAVRLAAPRIPAAGRARATGSEDSVDVRVAGFGSEQPRPTSALCLGLRLGLRVGQRTRAQHGPTALRWWPRRDGASRSVEVEPCLLLGEGCPGWRCHWCGVPPLGGGVPAGFGGALLAGHGARQAARRARKTAERRAASLGRRLRGGSTKWEARESTRLGSTDSPHKRMELIQAVKNQDVEKVEVRRPLEAVSSTESGPSRGVCLGLGRWTLDAVVARPIRPC